MDYARRKGASVDRARPARALRLRVRDADGADEPAPHPDVETVFMMPAETYSYVSSRLVKEVFALGGDVDGPRARRCRGAAARASGRDQMSVLRRTHDAGSATSPTMKVAAEAERLRRAGRGRRRPRRRRARFPDARAREGRGARRHRREPHEVHRQRGHRRNCARAIGERYRQDYGIDVRRARDHRHRGRQAGAVQRDRSRCSARATR